MDDIEYFLKQMHLKYHLCILTSFLTVCKTRYSKNEKICW